MWPLDGGMYLGTGCPAGLNLGTLIKRREPATEITAQRRIT